MACRLRKYVNLTGAPIRFVKGVSGVPWPGCDAEPMGVIEAPDSIGYHQHCIEAGFTPMTPEIQVQVDEEAQLRAMLAADEAKAKEEPVKAVEETPPAPPEPPPAPTSDPEPEPAPAVPLVPPPEVKRRGRRN